MTPKAVIKQLRELIAALQDKDATQDALIESLKVRIRAVKEEIESA